MLGCAFAVLANSASAQESGKPDLDKLLHQLRTAAEPERDGVIHAVLQSGADFETVHAKLGEAIPVPALAVGWSRRQVKAADGVERPYVLYIPQSIKGSVEAVPLLVHMHGGVGRAEYPPPGQVGYGSQWVASAENEGFVVAYPLGRRDTNWWNDAGLAHIEAVIRDTKRLATIDDDRIVATGFSDGGSGCYFLAMAAPDLFSGFLAMNGHPRVPASASRRPLYLRNVKARPLFVAMTQDDQLYPARRVLPHLLAVIEEGARMHIVQYPTGGHRPVYWAEQLAAFVNFIASTEREALPDRIDWFCAEPALGRIGWIEVEEIGAAEGDAAAVEDLNVESRPGRVLLGVSVDQAFAGPGVRIANVTRDSLASEMKLEAGDVVVSLRGNDIKDLGDLRRALAATTFGDEMRLRVRRGDRELTPAIKIPPFQARPVYLRGKPTARISAEIENNRIEIVSRNVRRLRLRFAPRHIDFDAEVVVIVNGTERLRQKLTPDLEQLVRGYAADADAGRLFAAETRIELPAAK
ncbi:MAG: PDZ domain-containing protein [Planctomycetota bacterium]